MSKWLNHRNYLDKRKSFDIVIYWNFSCVMSKKFKKTILPLIALTLSTSSLLGIASYASGSFGAKIYCTMREDGNGHDASWQAAYETINF